LTEATGEIEGIGLALGDREGRGAKWALKAVPAALILEITGTGVGELLKTVGAEEDLGHGTLIRVLLLKTAIRERQKPIEGKKPGPFTSFRPFSMINGKDTGTME